MRRAVAVMGLLLAASLPGRAAEVLTLDEALRIASVSSQPILAADAQAEAAAAAVHEAKTHRLPQVVLSETYSRTTNPAYVFMNLLGQEAFGPQDFDPEFLNHPPPLNNFNSKVQVTQPIYVGGKINAGTAAAEQMHGAATADAARVRQQVAHRVIEAYSGAVLAAASREVVLEAQQTARAHVKLVTDLKETGMVVESDLLQAKVHLAEVEEQLINVEAASAVARAGLNIAMGRDVDTPVVLPAAIELRPDRTATLDELTKTALANRKDLGAMQSRVAAADAMERVARASHRPEVGFTGMYEANKESYPGADGSNWSLFVGASWAVFDGGTTGAKVARARADRAAAEQMNVLTKQTAALEVRQAWYALSAARQRLVISGAAAEQARAALALVEDRYKEGLTTIVELMGAQTAVTQTKNRELEARRDVLLGQASLDLATGQL